MRHDHSIKNAYRLPISAPFYCQLCTSCMHEQLPRMDYVRVTATYVYPLTVMYVPFDCYVCVY